MARSICDCGVINDIILPNQNCPEIRADINRLLFRKKQASGAGLILKTDALLQATWSNYLTLPTTDVLKMAITPPDVLTESQNVNLGNITTTANTAGLESIIAPKGWKFTGALNHLSPATVTALDLLFCNDLEVFFVLNDGSILAKEFDALNITGFGIRRLTNKSVNIDLNPTLEGTAPARTSKFPLEFIFSEDNWYPTSYRTAVNFGLKLLN
jgi:hypothetical protein